MARYFLKQLDIEGFRGINNDSDPLVLKFKTDAVNSVFAPNGTGKSSVYEAVSYIIRGCIPKLDELPPSDKAGDYYVNKFHSRKEATVIATFSPDDGTADVVIKVSRNAKGERLAVSPSGCPNPEGFLKNLDSEVVLLDARAFSDFIDDSPLHRGRAFSSLLGLGKLSEFRQTLEALANSKNLKTDFELESLEYQLKQQTQETSASFARVRQSFEGLSGESLPNPWTHKGVGAAAQLILESVPLLKPFLEGKDFELLNFTELRDAIKKAEAGEKRDRLADILKEIAMFEKLASEVDEAEEQRQLGQIIERRKLALQKTQGALFHQLYESAEKIIKEGGWADDVCPLCVSKVEDSISGRIDACLHDYSEVTETKKLIREQWSQSKWVERLKTLQNQLEKEVKYAEIEKPFTSGTASAENLTSASELLTVCEGKRVARIVELKKEKDIIEQELPPSLVALTEQIQHAETLQVALKQHSLSKQGENLVEQKLTSRAAWCKFISDTSSSFAAAEVALSTNITTGIESEYTFLYKTITSNAQVIPLLKKASGSEELQLRLSKFYTLKDVSAIALLPESYRNALAMAIFLSATRRRVGGARFVVLDDITSSFDSGHQWNFMELLRSKLAYPADSSGPQFIILSHDGLLEKYFDVKGAEQNWYHQKLQGMPPEGFVFSNTQNAQRLEDQARHFLAAGQVEQASPLMRQYLEFSLLQVVRKLGIPVPIDFAIRDDKKMAGDTLDVINDHIKLHKTSGTLILTATQLSDLENLHIPALVGNWLNHYATGSTASLSPHVLVSVVDTINNYVSCFMYTCNCNGTPQLRFYKSLSEKRCKC